MDVYKGYTLDQFVWDEAFRSWVLHPTAASDKAWKDWLGANKEMLPIAMEAREVILALRVDAVSELHASHIEEAVRKTVTLLQKGEQLTEISRANSPKSRWLWISSPWLKYAAVILLVCGIGWGVFRERIETLQLATEETHPISGNSLQVKSNNTSKLIVFRLSDGSSVHLYPGSSIRYPLIFTPSKREVSLVGAAFFDIEKDVQRPFYVKAGELVTKVLGTSFWVRSFASENGVTVKVKTGRVEVFVHKPGEKGRDATSEVGHSGTVLTPNQQVLYARNELRVEKSLVENPQPLVSIMDKNAFVFDETPISEAFHLLSTTYGVEIVFDTAMKDCPVTAAINGLSLYEQLSMLCKAVGAKYSSVDGRIIIEGSSCR